MKQAAVAALLALAASAAQADEITLTRPMAGASVHEAGVDMVVYWTPAEGGSNVVATYAVQEDRQQSAGQENQGQARRLSMLLQDGDSVSFGLPGVEAAFYTFSNANGAVHVEAVKRVKKTVASR